MQAQVATQARGPRWLYVISAVAFAPILLWPLFCFSSFMAVAEASIAQDPGSIWMQAGLALSYPVLTIIGVPISLKAYRGNRKRLAYVFLGIALLPLLGLLAIAVAFTWWTLGPSAMPAIQP